MLFFRMHNPQARRSAVSDPANQAGLHALFSEMPPLDHTHFASGGRSRLCVQLHSKLRRAGWQIVKVDPDADRRLAVVLAVLLGVGTLFVLGMVATWRFLCIG